MHEGGETMKKRICSLLLAAMILTMGFAGCGEKEKKETAKQPEQTEQSGYTEKVAGAAAVVEAAHEQAERDYTENGLIPEERILTMVQMAASASTDPCADEALTQELALNCAYLETVGKEKAPDHPVTQLAAAEFAYIEKIVIEGQSYTDPEVEAAMTAMDEVAETYFNEDGAAETLAAEFYQLVSQE